MGRSAQFVSVLMLMLCQPMKRMARNGASRFRNCGKNTVVVPQFLNLLAPFRAMRFMGWQSINMSTLTNWADRPIATSFGQSAYGEPYEQIVELVNETGKDCWINVPELATDDFVHNYAKFVATHLDFTRIQ